MYHRFFARGFGTTALGFGFLPREEDSRVMSSSLGALRFDPAFLDEPVLELSASTASPIVEIDSRFREDWPGLGRRDPAEPCADERDRIEDAGEVLAIDLFSALP